MASNPTKILLYDLDENLIKLIEDIIKFQGGYTSLYERLMDLNTDTFTDEVQKVIDDLISGYQDGGILTIKRIEQLEQKSELSERPKYEEFSYDADQNIELITTYDKADPATRLKLNETKYEYGTVNGNKEITKSTATVYMEDGTTVLQQIIKQYSYDANSNVSSIATSVV